MCFPLLWTCCSQSKGAICCEYACCNFLMNESLWFVAVLYFRKQTAFSVLEMGIFNISGGHVRFKFISNSCYVCQKMAALEDHINIFPTKQFRFCSLSWAKLIRHFLSVFDFQWCSRNITSKKKYVFRCKSVLKVKIWHSWDFLTVSKFLEVCNCT